MDHKKRETANDACKTLEEALSHASTLEGNVATLQGELRRKKRKSTRKRAEITVQKRILRKRMRAVNDLDLDYELGVAEPNNDPAVALPELVRHVRSLNSVQGTQEHVCKMARLRATSLLNHLDLDRMFSVSTAETKAELAITQAAADSAKQDAEDAAALAFWEIRCNTCLKTVRLMNI